MELAAPRTSYQDLLDTQRDLFQNQIEKLQQIVATQCKLTGVNPLSQEMAAGALSIKIGKRPRDLLNPKAVKYMQLVFSVKDVISKRETREISAQFGVTVTQVRDFFTGRRTRVRKCVRLSKEKANRSSAHDPLHNETASASDPNTLSEPVPIDTIAPVNIDEGPSCSKRHESFTGMDESDLHFVENIFSLMRKEDSFSGQVKLLRRILRIENPSVLNWFLTEGGLMILATWLSEAAKEEQTSFLRVILKLLDNLPLRKALPVHMSAILQSVNRLRFYRTSGVFFYFINEVMGNESWESKVDNSEEPLRFLCDSADNHRYGLQQSVAIRLSADSYYHLMRFLSQDFFLRKLDAVQPLKMLIASGDDSNKRRGVLSSRILLLFMNNRRTISGMLLVEVGAAG
ncbi:UNVERIFIED_CONTAM: Homeobox protein LUMINIDEPENDENS [Sesamum radiatum]|uniref:Homeobox protein LUMINIDEPENDENS n=1 Tax=Sesamum radiatum TaxID=300843 RepID=A0AAW2W2F6_SESRA